MHAVYLLTYAIRNEYIPQWHSREDYLAAANGLGGQYHDWFEIQFRTGEPRREGIRGRPQD